MTTRQPPRRDVDAEVDSTSASPGTFNAWLQRTFKASRLTQRQLAHKTGVHHSTISRLIRGDRAPSLRTAASLARALGMPDGPATLDDQSFGITVSRAARVEYALRSDESLSEADIREIMEVYLALRRPPFRPVGAVPKASTRRAPVPSARRAPVPIVVQVPELRSRSSARRRPVSERGGSS